MKFTVEKETLLPVLTRINNIVEKKSTKPVLSHVLIEARDGQLHLTGLNIDIKITGTLPADIEEPGQITTNSQRLFAIISTVAGNPEVTFSLNGNLLDIAIDKSKYELNAISADDFPETTSHTFSETFSLPCDELVRLFNLVKFSMAVNDLRYFLNGVLLDIKPAQIAAVSTDGHRLSIAEIPNTFNLRPQQIIVPRKVVGELISWLGHADGEVKVGLSGSHMQLSHGSIELTSTVIKEGYPAYENLLPEVGEDKAVAVVSKDMLKQALQQAKVLSGAASAEYLPGVSLTFDPWKLKLTARNTDNEWHVNEVDINYDGPSIKTAFNINYLLDVLNGIEGDNVAIYITNSGLFYDPEGEVSRYVVMPMNI